MNDYAGPGNSQCGVGSSDALDLLNHHQGQIMNDEINELSTSHLAAPNPTEYFCEGMLKIGKEISLALASKDLQHGRWDVSPAAVITGHFDGTAFRARGRLGDDYGTNGTVKYNASDDATFFLDFNVPVRGNNTVNMHCEGKDCNLYSYSVSYVPASGRTTTPTYTIVRK